MWLDRPGREDIFHDTNGDRAAHVPDGETTESGKFREFLDADLQLDEKIILL